MTDAISDAAYRRFLPWRRTFEVGFWVALMLVNAVGHSITTLMDVRRAGLTFASWEPAVWEGSSAILMLALVPALVVFTRRFPLHWDTWRRQLPWYLLASLAVDLRISEIVDAGQYVVSALLPEALFATSTLA